MSQSKPEQPLELPTFGAAFRFWLKLGFVSFGGPAGQIAIMHRELVERRAWISEGRFLHALNYCMLLPGPEAQQLATYVGWLLHGTRGGVVAGVLFVLPAAVVLWALSLAYMTLGDLPWVASILDGLKPAVLAIVAAAVIRIGQKVLKNPVMFGIAVLALIALGVFHLPFPVVIASAGMIGWIGGRLAPAQFVVLKDQGEALNTTSLGSAPSIWRNIRVVLVCGALWWAPIVAVGLILGWSSVAFQQGIFFSKTAMVTFGGAYAVLPYVSQHAVGEGWLSAPQMLDGLGLAETTPGPLIIVLQFVGFVGAWQNPGALSPLTAATLGAAITTWASFAPCFLWIFLGAPYVERLRGNLLLNAALSTITAAVVGVILNLAIWFGWHILQPEGGRLDWFASIVAAGAFAGLVRWKWGAIPIVAGGVAAGLVRYLAVG